ncbi:DUF397 domain-containing protein [Streptomyces sp. NPDC053427]|uniref:DUF397 domain-containing protein n=1 Tax=Streptomyces sp. NPDC053427 TaxID=3365701 RepID=UPI0037D6CADE
MAGATAPARSAVRRGGAVAHGHAGVPVSDSKRPTGPALVFSAGSWSSFVSAVKRGDFPA